MSQAILHPLNLPLGTEQRKKTTTTLSLLLGTLLLVVGIYGQSFLLALAGILLSYYWLTANARASFLTGLGFGIILAILSMAGILAPIHGLVAVVLLVGAYDWHHTHLRKMF